MLKSFTRKFPFTCCMALVLFGTSFLLSCSKSDDQKKFENRAYNTPPQGIIAMDKHGNQKKEGENDPNDWIIGPNYAGLISVTPAFPNPVLIGEQFLIQIDFGYIDTVKRVIVYAKDQNTILNNGIPLYESEVSSALDGIPLNSAQFADGVGVGESNIYRILIYDGRNNIITYGDIQIGQSGTP